MTEFELGDITFRINKLDAFKQFHLSRKVAPILPTLIPIFTKLATTARETGNTESDNALLTPLSGDIGGMAEVMTPLAEGIAEMSDEAAEYILGTCLSVVQRRQDDKWYPVWNTQQRVCLFDDLDLGVMIKLAIRVITDSLGPFIRGMLTGRGIPKA
ncbi:phage tail assembly chaperone [Pseudomonas sp. NPDC098747]|uniref:phage tail assembly chaperone n=1 Tax=Pseudomonas sp. NPDC098747 TaxID=3364487 RepID=UPI00383AD374